MSGRQIPLQAGLEERAIPQSVQERAGRSDAGAAGPLGGQSRRRTKRIHSASRLTGAGLPQFDLQRNADVDGAGATAEVMIHPEDARGRHRRTRMMSCSATRAARCTLHAKHLSGRAARRADRGIDMAECGLRRRVRHQHTHRRRFNRALWRCRCPRQQGMGAAAQISPPREP